MRRFFALLAALSALLTLTAFAEPETETDTETITETETVTDEETGEDTETETGPVTARRGKLQAGLKRKIHGKHKPRSVFVLRRGKTRRRASRARRDLQSI